MTRPFPRISVNKLGEYMTASVIRRRSILDDQKHPAFFQVIRYSPAERAVIEWMESRFDPSVLARHKEALRSKPILSEYDAQQVALCLEAIDHAGRIPVRQFPGIRYERCAFRGYLEVAGVDVSVRPELTVADRTRRGEPRFGFVKLCFSRSYPLTEAGAAYVGTVAQELAAGIPDAAKPHPSLALVVDVFQERVFVGPTSTRRRLSEIEAACEEIAGRWEAL
jgi:hypothetical protein